MRLPLSNASHVVRLAKATTTMFQLASGILGAAAATLALGTVHLEVSAKNDQGQAAIVRPDASPQVVRAGKGDRLPAPSSQAQNLTVSFQLPAADSSVMMRVLMPADGQTMAKPKGPAPADRASTGKRKVACEPYVCVLTPVAKLLQPARCIT